LRSSILRDRLGAAESLGTVLSMATILIVEDEPDLAEVLRYNLEQAGHRTLVASSGGRGLEMLAEESVDLVLLDLMLPDVPGTEVCRSIRRSSQFGKVPVIMLTARVEEIDRVVGFEVGADDYVTKPFSVRELVLRIDAVLRRASSLDDDAEQEGAVISFGELRIDQAAHRVWVAGEEVELSALEFRLLVTLLQRKNRVQSRSRLLDDVWGIQADVTTRTVDTHVKRLREKIGVARDYIETVRGVGYRFVSAPPEPGSVPAD